MSSSLNHAVFIQIKNLIQGLINKKVMRNVKNELLAVKYKIIITFIKQFLAC